MSNEAKEPASAGQTEETLPAVVEEFRLTPAAPLNVIRAELKEREDFVRDDLKEDRDYGSVPGVPKPFLWKPGAERICFLYGLAPSYEIDADVDYDKPFFAYTIKCTLTHSRSGKVVGQGVGSANSYEDKWRYRWKELPDNTRDWDTKKAMKKAGTGKSFLKGKDKKGKKIWGWKERAENTEIASLANTILKIAKKRAYVDATLSATGMSDRFTQDQAAVTGTEEPGETGSIQEGDFEEIQPVTTAPDVPQPGEFTHDHEPPEREREPGEDDEPPPHEDPDEGAGQPPANAPSTKQVKFFQKLEADLIDEVGAEQAVETLTAIQKERGLPVTCAPKNVYEKRQMSKLIDGLLAALGRG